jgi:hypothetical protein
MRHIFHAMISPDHISKAAHVVCHLHNNPSSDTIWSQIKFDVSSIAPSTTTEDALAVSMDLFEYFRFFRRRCNRQMYMTREVLKTFPHERYALLKSQPYSRLQP